MEVVESEGNYSTNEHIVGKWIDGTTDVYEKTYTGTSTPTNNQVVDSSLTSANTKLISQIGSFLGGSNAWYMPYFKSNSEKLELLLDSTNLKFQIAGVSGISFWCATIRYIKVQ